MKYVMPLVLLFALFSFSAEVKWVGWTEGFAAVKAKKKPAIIDFYTDWCHWCKVMDEKTFRDPKVSEMLKKSFVTMRINPETSKEKIAYEGKEFQASQFAQGLGVQGYPAIAFMDNKGKFITVMPGFSPPEDFIQVLQYVKDECYAKGVKFEDYKKSGKCK